MANPKNETRNYTTTRVTAEGTVEVLYQKMGDRWFAFSLIDNEVFVGSITQAEIDEAEMATAGANDKVFGVSGNS
jgi:hypothetical protein